MRNLTPLAPLSHRPHIHRERGEFTGGGAPLPAGGGAMGEGTGVRWP